MDQQEGVTKQKDYRNNGGLCTARASEETNPTHESPPPPFPLTTRQFLLFLFNLWRLWVLLVQTGAPLLKPGLLLTENLILVLLLTDILLWELWRNREQRK
ncbi:hypothetical protein EYF80_052556 [Liparis tanakae]|uniref:Uncharacterized protein n=1 Tax=Liparis tanakae TaxID=230148 RepID=A0A4Z2F8E1_9TELE|nr:hypothetical protein EYF80_052556 [Liparis tanakae]